MFGEKVFRMTKDITVEDVGKAVKDYLLTDKKMITMGGITNSGSYLIQAKDMGAVGVALDMFGVGKALLVQIIPKDTDEVTVKLGQGKWEKNWLPAAMVGVTLFPLPTVVGGAIGAAVGAYSQYSIADDIFECIENFIKSDGNVC